MEMGVRGTPVMLAVSMFDRFDHPAVLWLALLPVAVWWLSRRSLAGLSPGQRRAALATRCLLLVLLVLALAGLNRVRVNRDLAVIFVLDQSRSVPPEQQQQARRFVRQAGRDAPPADRVGAVTFDGEAYIEQLPTRPGPDGGLYPDVALVGAGNRPDRTNLAAAVRLALACFPEDAARRIVLLSDGNQNDGDVLSEVAAAAANRVSIDVVPIRYQHEREVTFERLSAPAYARERETASLRLTLRSTQESRGRVQIYHDGRVVDLDASSPQTGQRVDLQPGLNSFVVRLPLNHSGTHRFEARYEPDDPADDDVAANNVAIGFTTVEGPAMVLLISADPAVDAPLAAALQKEQIRLLVRRAAEVEIDALGLQQYSAVIISNVAADQFPESAHKALASYVRDLGGGLIMVGGDEGFGAGGWQASTVEQVMPVRFDVDEIRQIPRGALAIVMHACEMPQGNRWAIETAVAAMNTLSRLDYFGIVAWAGMGMGWQIPMRLCDDKAAITNQIRRMQHGDAPSFEDMMDLAYQGLAGRRDAAQRHMIVISDGDPAPPSKSVLNKLVRARITVSTVSVFPHSGFDIGTMTQIARATGGNTYMLNKPGDERMLPQIFIKEARVVRRPLLREEEFVPRVKDRLSDLLAGIGAHLPPLRGYVVTTPRSAAEIEQPLVSDKGDPILAHWQCGLGRSAAFTSGWWPRWGPDWVNWSAFSKLWAQTIRWCMAQGTAKDFEVATFVESGRGRVVVEALNQDAQYLNFLTLGGLITRPDGDNRPIRLEQTGPGRYEGTFDMPDTGAYLLSLRAGGQGIEPALIRTGLSVAYSPEYRDRTTNEALLRDIVRTTGGRWLDAPPEEAGVFLKNLPESLSRRPIWSDLLKAAMICFLLDVAVRRVAIDPRKAARRLAAYVADVAGRFAPARRAEAVLAELKTVREKVREERTGAGEGAALPKLPRVDSGRKFEAPADTAAPTGDLARTLGGAQAAPQKPKADAPPESGESTTARLLKSRRKRRDEGGETRP